jgi:hypothetical protein
MAGSILHAKHTVRSMLLLSLALTGSCGNSSKIAALSTSQLYQKAIDCRLIREPSPGIAISCRNIERECKRRSDKQGVEIC